MWEGRIIWFLQQQSSVSYIWWLDIWTTKTFPLNFPMHRGFFFVLTEKFVFQDPASFWIIATTVAFMSVQVPSYQVYLFLISEQRHIINILTIINIIMIIITGLLRDRCRASVQALQAWRTRSYSSCLWNRDEAAPSTIPDLVCFQLSLQSLRIMKFNEFFLLHSMGQRHHLNGYRVMIIYYPIVYLV